MNHKEIYDLNILSESLISNDETFQQACDDDLMRRLALDDERSFDSIFKLYYKDLLLYAGSYLRERQVCEDIVQSLFMHLWYDRKTLSVGRSLKSYLLISVRNRCFDYMRHQNVRNDYFDYVNENSVLSSSNTEEYILYSELQDHIKKAINKLPKAQKEVFVLSRIKGIKYKEIAKKLNVSERTVEVRISQSLKTLRTLLKDFFLFIAVLFVR